MATSSRVVLFQLGTTLFFVLFMLMPAAASTAQHGKKDSGVLMLYGTARCKSNPSRTINNATLQVTINGTMVASGETNRLGRFLLVANVTSRNQLVALTRKEATITAPPGACGVPATAPGRKLAAGADLSGSDDDVVEIPDLGMMILSGDPGFLDRLVNDILNNSPPVDDDDLPVEFRENILPYIDQNPETITITDVSNFVEASGLALVMLPDIISDFLGIPSN